MEVAEGFLLRHDGDVILRGVMDEGRHIGGRHGAAGRRDKRRARVGEGVLEVGRIDVELVGGEGADLALLELERGDRAAGEVVVETAMRERGPVADGGAFEVGDIAIPDDELLDGLRAVEAGVGCGDDSELVRLGDDDIALVVHCGIEGEVRGGEHGARRGGVGAQQIDDWAAGMGGDTVLLDGRSEIVGGEAVLGIERAGADEDSVVE